MWVFSGAPCRRDQHGVRGMSDLERRAEARDAGRRVAWVGVAAWDVGLLPLPMAWAARCALRYLIYVLLDTLTSSRAVHWLLLSLIKLLLPCSPRVWNAHTPPSEERYKITPLRTIYKSRSVTNTHSKKTSMQDSSTRDLVSGQGKRHSKAASHLAR